MQTGQQSNYLQDLTAGIIGTYREIRLAESQVELEQLRQNNAGESRAERVVNEDAAAQEDTSGPGSLIARRPVAGVPNYVWLIGAGLVGGVLIVRAL